jgi:hypothetical protein
MAHLRSVNDLMAIRGIGPDRLEKMRMYLTVGKPKSANAAAPAKCSGCSTEKSRALPNPRRARKLSLRKFRRSNLPPKPKNLKTKSRKIETL